MPTCTGGSEPKAGSPSYIHIDPFYAASLLPPALSWVVPFLSYIPSIDLNVGDFCSLEPPELPTIDASDAWSLVNRDYIGLAISAGYKLTQLVHYYAWFKLCQCSTGGTPAADSGYSAPSDLPAINPPGVVTGLPVGACADYSGGPATGTTGGAWVALVGGGAQGSASGAIGTPAGVTSVRLTYTRVDSGGTRSHMSTHFEGFNAAGAFAFSDGALVTTAAGTTVRTLALTGCVSFKVLTSVDAGSATADAMSVRAEFFCGGSSPGQTQAPCCPPDPVATGILSQILDMVTLLQRQLAPYSTIDTVAHSGLTGTGEIDVQGLIGVRVDIIELPDSYGVAYGDPDRHYDLGWIAWGDPGSWHVPERVIADPHRSAPTYASACTRIGYSFNPGVMATIVEMQREP